LTFLVDYTCFILIPYLTLLSQKTDKHATIFFL
jgi:hypothetical protein